MASNMANVMVTVNEVGSSGTMIDTRCPPAWIRQAKQEATLNLYDNGLVKAIGCDGNECVLTIEQLQQIVETWKDH